MTRCVQKLTLALGLLSEIIDYWPFFWEMESLKSAQYRCYNKIDNSWCIENSIIVKLLYATWGPSLKCYYTVKMGSYRTCMIIKLSTVSVDISNSIKINGNIS